MRMYNILFDPQFYVLKVLFINILQSSNQPNDRSTEPSQAQRVQETDSFNISCRYAFLNKTNKS